MNAAALACAPSGTSWDGIDWIAVQRRVKGLQPDTTVGTWALKLVVCRITTQRKTRGGDHEFDPVCAHKRA